MRMPACKDTVQFFVVARKLAPVLPRIDVLLDEKLLRVTGPGTPCTRMIGVAEAVGVKHLEVVVFSARDVSRSGMHADHGRWGR